MMRVADLLKFQLKVLSKLFTVFCIAALLFLGIGPRLFGYRTMTVLTGSMEPSYPPGSVVVVAQEPVSALHVGQILAYQAPIEDHRVVTHRVIDVSRDGEAYVVQTKGDANNGPDPWRARVSDAKVWTVRFGLPLLGSMIRVLRTPIMHKILVLGMPMFVALLWIAQIWRRPSQPVAAPAREVHA